MTFYPSFMNQFVPGHGTFHISKHVDLCLGNKLLSQSEFSGYCPSWKIKFFRSWKYLHLPVNNNDLCWVTLGWDRVLIWRVMNTGSNNWTRAHSFVRNHVPDYARLFFDGVNFFWDTTLFICELIASVDGTYIYIHKSSSLEHQKKTYSKHKGRNLVKLFMIVAPDGTFLDVHLIILPFEVVILVSVLVLILQTATVQMSICGTGVTLTQRPEDNMNLVSSQHVFILSKESA